MDNSLFKQLEAFRKQKSLSILALCGQMGIYNHTYHRWKKSGKITDAYQRIISDFLARKDVPQTTTADIAVIGIGCFYPGASSPSELWENILARRVQFRRMLDQRLPLSEYYDQDPKAPEKTYLTKAAFLENFQFDWGRLRIPKKTVESTDIAHWLALDIALKTFEDAGYKLSEIPLQNTGVIVGNTLTGEQTRSQTLRLRWPYVQKALNATLDHLGKSIEERSQIASEMEKIYKSAFYPVTEDSLAGGLANTIAGRICNYLNLKGGGYIVDGACSSSLLAVATAADALKMGNMDLVLAGGVDISLDPFELVGFAKAGALARDQMRVYDQKANGFLPGEGCGFVLLKRLKDAIRDKNYVYATIKGWGISSDGRGGIMEPSSSGQAFAIGRAYKDLEYKISDVDFVEGHGTGTTKGDRVELEGIATAIEKTIKKGDENKRGCGVTSFKSIVGHTKAAAGVGGFIKAVMAVNQRILPPTANCTQPNDVFNDKAKNLYPITLGGRLPQDSIARAGISSAGFGGINCHITVESKDKSKQELISKLDERALFVSPQETEIFVFTSRAIIHLKKIIGKFKEDLRNISIAEMADLAALLNKKVKHRLPIKVAIVTDSPEHLYDALVMLENEITSSDSHPIYQIKAKDPLTHIILSNNAKKSRIGFLYPGQGSQRLNMTRTLVHRYSWARNLFHLSKLPLFETIYASSYRFLTKEQQQEFEQKLADTKITQPAIVLSSLIWTEFFSKLGIEPQISVGHSLGELMAFYKAGAFNKEALIKFAQLRGELMASKARTMGSMVSLFCSKEKAEDLVSKISDNIVIANINSPNQIVVSGGKKEIEKIKELAKKESIPAYQLNVSNAFHSSFMKEASDKIRKTKIIPEKAREYFSNQVISRLDFVGMIESASPKCDLMIEVGPGRVLTDLVKAINKEMVCLPVESSSGNDRDLNIVLAEIFVRNVPVKFEELYKNRLIKTFVPASRKKFIENQCEHPLKIDKQVLQTKFLPVLLKVKEEPDQEEVMPGVLPELTGGDKVADLLMSLTHEITGFERESISLNLRLLDDLNLDSIKAAELIGKAARALGIAGQVDPSQLSNNTLGQIRDRLNELVVAATAGAVKESINDILKRYQDKTWVRNFTSELRPEEIKTRNVNQLMGLRNIVFLSGKNEESLVKKLSVSLRSHGAKQSLKLQQIYFGESKAQAEKGKRIDCLITILPKNLIACHSRPLSRRSERSEESQQFNKVSLKSIMEQLHQMTDLATSGRLDKGSFVILIQFGGGATSLVSTLFLERPDLKVRVIDFDERIDENKISQKIIDELQTYESFNAVEYDSKLARRVVYYENSYPAEYKKRKISWSGKDIVLVSGGAKGITAQCALEFARSTKAQMVLVGRSPFLSSNSRERRIDRHSQLFGGNPEITQTLKQFENEKLKCSYYQCDVSNEKDVASTIAEIEKKLGKITGFIHGAGLNSLKRLKQANIQEAFQEALPKVMGAVNICKALSHKEGETNLKLIVGITSIIGLIGMEGSGWYGFSNEVLNLYLHHKFSVIPIQKTEVVTIAYSVWDELGMGAKLGSVDRLAEKGIGAIPVAEGVKHFKELVEGNPGTQQVIVAARLAGIGTWKSADLKTNNFRFLEKIEYVLPGVELIARANLNIEDDPYLLDHNWKGSLLFPFVFGFEAMAQAVAYVLGIEKFDHINVRDINLQRPISVPQDSATTIEIHAQALPCRSRESGNLVHGHRQVKVEIYSQETAYKEPHFSAIFEVDMPSRKVIPASTAIPASSTVIPAKAGIHNKINPKLQQKAKNVIDLDIQTDIYGPILFQGKMFQCIEQIHELYYDEATKKGECIFTSAYNKSAKEFLEKNKKFNKRFLIGDPFFIDTLLQAMQLVITPHISLPNYIEQIILFQNKKEQSINFVSHININEVNEKLFNGNVHTQSSDNYVINIKNCKLKVLEYPFNKPSVNDLIEPKFRDQRIIQEELQRLSNDFDVILPVINCASNIELKKSNKQSRQSIELPIIKEAIVQYMGHEKLDGINVEWLSSGKPVIKGKDLDISLSHNGEIVICVVGEKKQGCDIEMIVERSVKDWRALLGRDKYDFLNEIINNVDQDINFLGTSLWSSFETLKKATGNENSRISLINHGKNSLIFGSAALSMSHFIVSFSIQLTRGRRRVISVIGQKALVKENKKDNLIVFGKFVFDRNKFKLDIEHYGPEKQKVYTKRFPVTFKHVQNLGNSVYFSNYFDWMGDIREYCLSPIIKDIKNLLETGKWGMATNSAKIKILGELRSDDVVEVRFWLKSISGKEDAVFDFMFDWLKVRQDGQFERVAMGEQRISWIKITGHGEGYIVRPPEIFRDFMSILKASPQPTDSSFERNEFSKKFDIGKVLLTLGNNIKNKILLKKNKIITSLGDSNLVGNIYFANYSKWLGETRDTYFYSILSNYYKGIGEKGEFVCLSSSIDHLGEAMPFDTILIKMFLEKVYENGIDFNFEFYKEFNNKRIQKLAFARHRVAWTRRIKNRTISSKIPNKLLKVLIKNV